MPRESVTDGYSDDKFVHSFFYLNIIGNNSFIFNQNYLIICLQFVREERFYSFPKFLIVGSK